MKHKIIAFLANHTCNIHQYNMNIYNVSILQKYISHFIIIDSAKECYAEQLYNDLSNNIKIHTHILIENSNYFQKWKYAIQEISNICFSDYEYILFVNDSSIHSALFSSTRYIIFID